MLKLKALPLDKRDLFLPGLLMVVFLAFTLPGITWGAPAIWHPDEIVWRALKALQGKWQFSMTNFDYPDLPQYIMYWLGRIILRLGYTDREVLVASRVLSALLGGLSVVLTYVTVRRMGRGVWVSALAGLLLICVTLMPHNARFAHNDMYLLFFSVLVAFCLVGHVQSRWNGWLYAAFLAVGLAASSKYNGIALVLAPIAVVLLENWKGWFRWATFGQLAFGGLLTMAGFAIGTPRSILSPVFYFEHMLPALIRTGNFLREPDSVRGVIGQYPVLAEGLGWPLAVLFAAGLIWACITLSRVWGRQPGLPVLLIPVLTLLAMDLPIMLSFNYQLRFFLTLMPPLTIFAALFVEALVARASTTSQWAIGAALTLLVAYCFARNISVMLLFIHDARFAATEYVAALSKGSTLEHTLYPPTIPEKHFKREHNYPLFFIKVPGDVLPTSDDYVFNVGEVGLDQRHTDYLVTDSFTYDRFANPFICANTQVECDFFKQLDTGRSNHYRLAVEFKYSLPPYLPQVAVQFVNPVIRIYERIP